MNVDRCGWAICCLLILGSTVRGDFIDLSRWTLVEDPPHPNFSASVTSTAAQLVASNGSVPVGVDIGFQSINGATAAGSTAGYVFSTDADFALAIDYAFTFTGSPVGVLGVGFGIGEDSDGENAAGVAMLTAGGLPFFNYTGFARVGDVNQAPASLPLAATLSGSLFVSYIAASGDVVLGAATTPGVNAPTATTTLSGIQNQWSDRDLLASFFLRSDLTGWQGGGTASASFSNLRVLAGQPTVVPEPGATVVLALIASLLTPRRGRRFG